MILDPKIVTDYGNYLKIERNFSNNTTESYLNDLNLFINFLNLRQEITQLDQIDRNTILIFISTIDKNSKSFHNEKSQARIISGLRSFFKYLVYDEVLKKDPTQAVSQPKLVKKIPDFLEVDEIEAILLKIDLSTPEGTRDRAMLELLFSAGMRVSELVDLKISNLYLDLGFVKVIGKGNKERLVTVGGSANNYLLQYIDHVRVHINIDSKHTNFVFVGQRTKKKLSRQYVFLTLQKHAKEAGIKKNVSPHTFRHSFASHMINGGADLRVIQELLGHVSITTTEIYTHLKKDFVAENIKKFHPRSDNNEV